MPKMTIPRLREMKAGREPIVMVTAYDYPSGRAAERAGVDMVLVGDSGSQVVLGHSATTDVSLDEMLMLAAAARRGVETPFFVCDLPFGTTELSDEQAVETAVRFVREAGADAVKIEGGNESRLSRIRAIVAAGIPVVGHVGLTPQTATALGGFRAQARTAETAKRLVADAFGVQEAGVSAMVIEAVPAEVMAELISAITVPVIGIGAGACDGQVLVLHDLVGNTETTPARFVKRWAAVGETTVEAISAYASEVRAAAFPAAEHSYAATPEAVQAVREVLSN